MHNVTIGFTKQLLQRTSNVVMETCSSAFEFHKKSNIDKHCEAIHFK